MSVHVNHAHIEALVEEARNGNQTSLGKLVEEIQKPIYALALRFLWHPQEAEDACQEILIRIINNLDSFRGNSQFNTWAYRVACNTLLTIKKRQKDTEAMSFDDFGKTLGAEGSHYENPRESSPDHQRLLEEMRIACVLAMLQCLNHESRLAYILGEIFELDHSDAAEAMETSQVSYRKRLSRARKTVNDFMLNNCGLANPRNPCRCHKQLDQCLTSGCISRDNLLFSKNHVDAQQFPKVLAYIRTLDETQRAAALYRQMPKEQQSDQFSAWLRSTLIGTASV